MTLFKSAHKRLGTAFIAALLSVFSLNHAHAASSQAGANDLIFMVEFNIKPEAREAFLMQPD